MGLQKYRFDREGERCPNGAVPVYSDWMGGPSLAGIRNCPIDGEPFIRTVYIRGEPDTFFTVPAACKVGGKVWRGYVTSGEAGYIFHKIRHSK